MRASMGARSPVGWPASLRTSWTAPPLLRLAPRMRRSPPRFSRPRPAMLVEKGRLMSRPFLLGGRGKILNTRRG